MNLEEEIQRVRSSVREDILKVCGLPPTEQWKSLCDRLLGKATRHLAEVGLTFDRLINEKGINQAADWAISHWCRDILFRNHGNVPAEGPLLVVSNHPGAYDALVIASRLPRPDLRIIASDLPFFRALDNFSRRIFYIPLDVQHTTGRMAGMLAAIRYLKDGGAVLLMGSGTIDPDPAVYPGALEHLKRWTEAGSLFLKHVPQTQILLAAVSHIVHPKWARHPLTLLQRGGMEKRRLAELGQVFQQLFFPGSLYVTPRLSFSRPILQEELGEEPRKELIRQESRLVREHCREFGGFLP